MENLKSMKLGYYKIFNDLIKSKPLPDIDSKTAITFLRLKRKLVSEILEVVKIAPQLVSRLGL